MKALQKLVRNGNSTHVAIPRQVLIFLGWLPGEPVVLEVLEDKSIRLSKRGLEGLSQVNFGSRTLLDEPAVTK